MPSYTNMTLIGTLLAGVIVVDRGKRTFAPPTQTAHKSQSQSVHDRVNTETMFNNVNVQYSFIHP